MLINTLPWAASTRRPWFAPFCLNSPTAWVDRGDGAGGAPKPHDGTCRFISPTIDARPHRSEAPAAPQTGWLSHRLPGIDVVAAATSSPRPITWVPPPQTLAVPGQRDCLPSLQDRYQDGGEADIPFTSTNPGHRHPRRVSPSVLFPAQPRRHETVWDAQPRSLVPQIPPLPSSLTCVCMPSRTNAPGDHAPHPWPRSSQRLCAPPCLDRDHEIHDHGHQDEGAVILARWSEMCPARV